MAPDVRCLTDHPVSRGSRLRARQQGFPIDCSAGAEQGRNGGTACTASRVCPLRSRAQGGFEGHEHLVAHAGVDLVDLLIGEAALRRPVGDADG